jgi:hypothetical protein
MARFRSGTTTTIAGSIAPARGGPDVFVDLAAFAPHEHGQRPLLHERLSFELALDRNGNLRARGVRRPSPVRDARPAQDRRPPDAPQTQARRTGRRDPAADRIGEPTCYPPTS